MDNDRVFADSSQHTRLYSQDANPHPRHHVALGNEWLVQLEQHDRQQMPDMHTSAAVLRRRRRVVPTLYTWDSYRIYLNVLRTNCNFDSMCQLIRSQAPHSSAEMSILSVLEHTDSIQHLQPEHLSLEENLFVVCVPKHFVLRVTTSHAFVADFFVTISPIHTVQAMKELIYRNRGFPVERMDLVFAGRCMDNCERLLHYTVHSDAYVHMHLHYGVRVKLKVISFWHKVYYLDVDITSTAVDILFLVMKLCSSSHTGQMVLKENYITPHFLQLITPGRRVIGYSNCIYKHLQEEDVEHLLVTTRYSPLAETAVTVLGLPYGDEVVQVNNGGKYGVVYLILHGLTDIPLNQFNLLGNQRTLNPYDVVNVDQDSSVIHLHRLKVERAEHQDEMELRVVTPSQTVIPLSVGRRMTVTEIKEALGVYKFPQVNDYELWYGERRLADSVQPYYAGIANRDFVHMTLRRFHIQLMLADDGAMDVEEREEEKKNKKPTQHRMESSRVLVHLRDKCARVLEDAEVRRQRSRHQLRSAVYLFCGEPVHGDRSVEECHLRPGNCIFQDFVDTETVMECCSVGDTVNRRQQFVLQRNYFQFHIRELLAEWRLPRHVVDAIEYLLLWRLSKPNVTEVIAFMQADVNDAFYAPQKKAGDAEGSGQQQQQQGRWQNAKARVTMNVIEQDYGNRWQQRADGKQNKAIMLPALKVYQRGQPINYDNVEGLDSLLLKPS